MPGKTLRAFWSKKKIVGPNVKAPLNAKDILKQLDKFPGLIELRAAITEYEQIDPANDPTCQLRMKALGKLDSQIYKWFNSTRVPELSKVKGSKEMAKLLKKSEQVHEQLVDATYKDDTVLPFDTSGLQPNEIIERETVWREMMDGTSQVQIGGSEKFQKKTRAKLAKMLETKTGFETLKFLGSAKTNPPDPGNRIVLSDILPDDLIDLPHLKPARKNVSLALQLTTDSDDYDLPDPKPAKGDEDPKEFPVMTDTMDLQSAIFSGAKGVIVNGMKYTFAKGSGSVVKTVPPKVGDEDSDTAGENGTEVITPAFITLAHELGHAVNIRSGAVTRNQPNLMIELCKKKNIGLTDIEIEEIWSNGEEYFTISNFENGLRRECGLPLRVAHKTRSAIVKMAKLKDLYKRINLLGTQDEAIGRMALYEDTMRYINKNKGNTDDDKVFEEIIKRVERVEDETTVTAVEEFKLENLVESRKEMDKLFNLHNGKLGDEHPLKIEYDDIDNELKNNSQFYVAYGTKDWYSIKKRIRELQSALGNL